MNNPQRFWFSLHGHPHFLCGWAFGDSFEAALEAAKRQIKKEKSQVKGAGTVSLQQDVSPAVYRDFKVEF